MSSEFIAPVLDRAAAFIVDMMILYPLMKIICSKLIVTMKITYSFQMFMGFSSAFFVTLWTAFTIYLTYQLAMIVFFKRTVGQYFFRIELRQHPNHQRPDSYVVILRTLLSFFTLLIWIPFIAVVTDEKGRTFYDKITDTVMVSLRPSGKAARSAMLLHRLTGSLLIFSFLIVICTVSFLLSNNFYKFKTDMNVSDKFCEEVTQAHDRWWDAGIHESRLEVASALFSAFKIPPSCLEKEVNFELSLNNQNSLAYLAKGFVAMHTNDSLAMEYFGKVCRLDPTGEPCELVVWIQSWPNAYEGEPLKNIKNRSSYLQVWSLRRDLAKGNMSKLADDLLSFDVKNGTENFYAEMQFKSSAYLNRPEESENVLKILAGTNALNSSFNERICASLLAQGCWALSQSACSGLDPAKTTNSHIRNVHYSCTDQNHNVFTDDMDLKKLYFGYKDGGVVDLDVIKNILKNNNHSVDVRMAALNKGFMLIKNPDYLKEMIVDWQNVGQKDFVWRMWGESLISHLSEYGDRTHSFTVFKSLNREYNESTSLKNIKARELTQMSGLAGGRVPAKTKDQ